MRAAARITLGTAQFGLDYGVTNRAGQVPVTQARAVLARAQSLGLQWLDTAAAYGSAEEVLGRLLLTDARFQICTKVMAALDDGDVVSLAQQQFDASLARLQRGTVDLLMIHNVNALFGAQGEQLYAWLQTQRTVGKAGAIGVSVYEPAEADALLQRYALDWVQLPMNVLDQRALRAGTLARLKAAGVRVQVRSALLQGLLLADPQRLPLEFAAAASVLVRLRTLTAEQGLSMLQAALGFVTSIAEVDQIVLGVESVQQLEECVAAAGTQVDAQAPVWQTMACTDTDVIDPRRWPRGVRLAA